MTATRRANPTYYGGDLRRDLMDAALELVGREGPSAVSLRSLARRLGVSHAAPANHFPDKASLFTAVAIEGFTLLAAAIEDGARRLGPGATASQRFRAAGQAYTSFALAHPAHFAVMWSATCSTRTTRSWPRPATPPSSCSSAASATSRPRAGPPAATPRPWPCWLGRWCTAWPPCGSAAPSSGPSGPSDQIAGEVGALLASALGSRPGT